MTGYKTIDHWLDEIEAFSPRRERVPEGAMPWIETAWELGRAARIAELEEQLAEVQRVATAATASVREAYEGGERRGAERMREDVASILRKRITRAKQLGEHLSRMTNENVLSEVKRLPLPPAPQEGE